MRPVYKVEFWEPEAEAALYTITDNATVFFKDILTDGAGNFTVVVPTTKDGSTFQYSDIDLFDTAKIWVGWGSVSGEPNFVGKVYKVTAPMSIGGGFIRQISGLSQTEILLRRFKRQRIWTGGLAYNFVTELAEDLDLGTGQIQTTFNGADTPIYIEVDTESYFDVLKRVSDYWVTAGGELKFDFYVDNTTDPKPNLVWKARAKARTVGVETLTVGQNIESYTVTRSLESVKNKILVYGCQGRKEPVNGDSWTYGAGWTPSLPGGGNGTATSSATAKVGGNSLLLESDNEMPKTLKVGRDISAIVPGFGRGIYEALNFWILYVSMGNPVKVRLYAPDQNNYFETTLANGITDWQWTSIKIGKNEEYDAIKNPTGPWDATHGTPNWDELSWLVFYTTDVTLSFQVLIDGLYFGLGRFRYTAEQGSPPLGVRDAEYMFDSLYDDDQCEIRAKTMLYQMKDYPIQIDVTTPGNSNILKGDRLNMTIPAEADIDSVDFDVISVEQSLADKWVTKATMVNSVNVRKPISTSRDGYMIELSQLTQALTKDAKFIR